jgi:hypothetical protein
MNTARIPTTPVNPEPRAMRQIAQRELWPSNGEPRRKALSTVRMSVDARGLALGILATVAVVFVLEWAQSFVISLLLGILIAYTLNPRRVAGADQDPSSAGRRICDGGRCVRAGAGDLLVAWADTDNT